MKKISNYFALAAILPFLLGHAISTLAQIPFKSAEVSSASDVQSPTGNSVSGIVVLDVSLDSEGAVTEVNVPRPVSSLALVATAAVRTWKFNPALLKDIPTPSVLRVAFAFRPPILYASPPQFDPLPGPADPEPETKADYVPPGIVKAEYPAYPINAANVGAVVIQMRVNSEGKAEDIKAIRPYNPFTKFALEAAGKWQFRAATLDGEPVPSKIAIAFVYSPPFTD
jgi:TonB family protein